MQDETHISDIANELFGIQSQLIFQFLPASFDAISIPYDLSKEYQDFRDWLTNKGYHISESQELHNLYYEVTFNQLIDLEGFVNNLEEETRGLSKHNKDNTLNCMVSDGYFSYLMVYENEEWKLARQRPATFYNYRGSGASTSGYAGSSSYSGYTGTTGAGGTFTGRVAPTRLTGKSGVSSGTTGTWSPVSSNSGKTTALSDMIKKLTARINGGSRTKAKKAGI